MDLLGAFTVVLTAMVKFLFAGLLSYSLGYGIGLTILLTACGGLAGMLVFYFTGTQLLEVLRRRYVRRNAERLARGLQPRRVFTRTNRWIVRVKQRYGIRGLAAFAPPTLSVPVTALLAAKYFRHQRSTLPTLLLSVAVWSVVLSVAWAFLR
ncbi:MAG: hypothetical protein R2817_09590 [Flavobacteriales bacterium]